MTFCLSGCRLFVCCQQSLKGKKSRNEPANEERGLLGTEGKRKKRTERGEEKGQEIKILYTLIQSCTP